MLGYWRTLQKIADSDVIRTHAGTPNALAGHRLNHSATLSATCLAAKRFINPNTSYCTCIRVCPYEQLAVVPERLRGLTRNQLRSPCTGSNPVGRATSIAPVTMVVTRETAARTQPPWGACPTRASTPAAVVVCGLHVWTSVHGWLVGAMVAREIPNLKVVGSIPTWVIIGTTELSSVGRAVDCSGCPGINMSLVRFRQLGSFYCSCHLHSTLAGSCCCVGCAQTKRRHGESNPGLPRDRRG